MLQLLAILGPFAYQVVSGVSGSVFYAYFTAGVVQLLSTIANGLFLDKFLRKRGRRVCEIVTVVLIILFGLSWINNQFILVYLVGLLFVAPVLSITYLVVSWMETNFIHAMVTRRELW